MCARVCLFILYLLHFFVDRIREAGREGGGEIPDFVGFRFFPPSSYCGFEMSNGFDKAQKRAGKVKDCQESV